MSPPLLVPFDEMPETLVERRSRRKTDGGGKCIDVREGRLDIARLHRRRFDNRPGVEMMLKNGEEISQAHGCVIADVIDAKGR
jgi:hypothetical protein